MNFDVIGCSTTWSVRPTSCYILDGRIMFDCGEGTGKAVTALCGADKWKDIDHIFITHLHTDHIFCINQYLLQNINSADVVKGRDRLKIVGIKGLRDALYSIFKFATTKKIRLEDYVDIVEITDYSKPIIVKGKANGCCGYAGGASGKNINGFNLSGGRASGCDVACGGAGLSGNGGASAGSCGDYVIQPFPLNHGDVADCGFAITKDGYTLGYTGDSIYDEALIRMVERCDAVVCDVSGMENKPNHMGVEGYNALKSAFTNKQFFAVHCGDLVFANAKKLGLNTLDSGSRLVAQNGVLTKTTFNKLQELQF